MTDRKKALASAQYQANLTGQPEVIYQVSNGQWMTASLDWFRRNEPGSPEQRACIINPTKKPGGMYTQPSSPKGLLIRVDTDVATAISERRLTGESINNTLRRVFGLEVK